MPVSTFSTIPIVCSHLSRLASFFSASCRVRIAAALLALGKVQGGLRLPTSASSCSGVKSPSRFSLSASVWSVASILASTSQSFLGAGMSFRKSSMGIRAMQSSPALKSAPLLPPPKISSTRNA